MNRKVVVLLAIVMVVGVIVAAAIYTQFSNQPKQGTLVFQKTYTFQQSSCYPSSCNATQRFNFLNGTTLSIDAVVYGGIAVSFSAAGSNGRPSFLSYVNSPPGYSGTWTVHISDSLQSQVLLLFDQNGYSANATITIRKT